MPLPVRDVPDEEPMPVVPVAEPTFEDVSDVTDEPEVVEPE